MHFTLKCKKHSLMIKTASGTNSTLIEWESSCIQNIAMNKRERTSSSLAKAAGFT